MSEKERPVLDQINIVGLDMPAMLAFYERLGVEIDRAASPPPWDKHHVSAKTAEGIDLDFDSSEFAAKWNEGWTEGAQAVVIGFKFASREAVDETYADMVAAGYQGQQPPWDAFWGARYAIVIDPNGNPVGLMSPSDPARRGGEPDVSG
jgi:uncharacterized glyoxalase superfamily protein PhnB